MMMSGDPPHKNLMVSSSYLILFILLFVFTVVCIFTGMYYNISVVCLCVSRQHFV